MRFSPASPAKTTKPVAIILGARPGSIRVACEDGEILEHSGPGAGHARDRDDCARILARLSGWQVYALPPLHAVTQTSGSDRWTGHQWRHALARVTMDDGPTVHPLHRPMAGVEPHEAAEGVLAALQWLWEQGVPPGSVSAMSARLWRRSLTRPIDLWAPELGDQLYGGRQEAPLPAEYRDCDMWDLTAAYPTSMADEAYARRMKEVSPHTGWRHGQGAALADVRIPTSQWGPLPIRLAPGTVCYITGTAGKRVRGWWTWRELAQAEDAGCDIAVVRSIAGLGSVDLFKPWWQISRPGRILPGPCGRLLKAVTSSLWGRFAMSSGRARMVRWSDHLGRVAVAVPDAAQHVPNRWASYVAAETTSRVRCRLYTEALIPLGTTVYCDTDGVIAGRTGGTVPASTDWRIKQAMTVVDIRGPQCYRWECDGCFYDEHARGHYCVAGAVDAGAAAHMFRRQTRRSAVPSVGHDEVTLPGMTLDVAITVVPPAISVIS